MQLIEPRIYVIRGQKVILDSDLAELYQVPTKRLNEAVLKNPPITRAIGFITRSSPKKR